MVAWKILAPARDGQPILLIKHDFQAAEYAVYITDLLHVWVETFDRKAIIKRAINEDTSIDPSEGTDQLKLLLRHLQSAVTGKHGTIRKLFPGKEKDNLVLQLQITLPAPLEPLIWSMNMRQESGDVLFQQLFLPAFEHGLQAKNQVDSLLLQVKEKDHVISRLTDKLENAGIEISDIFPGAQGAKGSSSGSRETLLRAVPGLREFDDISWRRNMAHNKSLSIADLFKHAFQDLDESSMATRWQSPDQWWHTLSYGGQILVATDGSVPVSDENALKGISQMVDEEEDFQVQDISKLKNGRVFIPDVQVKDSQPVLQDPHFDAMSTTDDGETDNLDSPDVSAEPEKSEPQEHKLSAMKSSVAPPSKRIGVLGKRQLGPSKSPSPIPESLPVEATSRALSPPTGITIRKKIGRIGGAKQEVVDAEIPDVPIKNNRTLVRTEADADEMSPAVTRSSDAEPDETEEERAERRRNELKQELEEKKKAPPKKKRKF